MMDRPSDNDPEDLDDLELFYEFASTRQRSIRNRLVERHMGLAAHIAKRFSRPGGTEEDLRQVAMLGLVKAIDRFDPHYGVRFAAFAGSTIEGELKRHFRDHSWTVRVPRSAKDLHLLVRRATDELVHKLFTPISGTAECAWSDACNRRRERSYSCRWQRPTRAFPATLQVGLFCLL